MHIGLQQTCAHTETELINNCDLLQRFKHHKTLPLFTPLSAAGQLFLNGAQIMQCFVSVFHCQDDIGGVKSDSGFCAQDEYFGTDSAPPVSHQSQVNQHLRHRQRRPKERKKATWERERADCTWHTGGAKGTQPSQKLYIQEILHHYHCYPATMQWLVIDLTHGITGHLNANASHLISSTPYELIRTTWWAHYGLWDFVGRKRYAGCLFEMGWTLLAHYDIQPKNGDSGGSSLWIYPTAGLSLFVCLEFLAIV